jgi:hypothetical protein
MNIEQAKAILENHPDPDVREAERLFISYVIVDPSVAEAADLLLMTSERDYWKRQAVKAPYSLKYVVITILEDFTATADEVYNNQTAACDIMTFPSYDEAVFFYHDVIGLDPNDIYTDGEEDCP